MAHLAILDGVSSFFKVSPDTIKFYTYPPTALGELIAPCWLFEFENNKLKKSNPELDDQARAATTYFSIIARNPVITSTDIVPWNDWTGVDNINEMLSMEAMAAERPPEGGSIVSFMLRESAEKLTGWDRIPANEAYFKAIDKLQTYIARRGLWDGIQKTLNEQARKSQAEKAALDAKKAAAAYAAAMARINADTSEEARIDAAKAEAKANEIIDKAQEEEIKLQQKLENISNGLPEDFGEVKTSPVILLAIGAAALWFIFGRGKK